jgi:hypothetical protein
MDLNQLIYQSNSIRRPSFGSKFICTLCEEFFPCEESFCAHCKSKEHCERVGKSCFERCVDQTPYYYGNPSNSNPKDHLSKFNIELLIKSGIIGRRSVDMKSAVASYDQRRVTQIGAMIRCAAEAGIPEPEIFFKDGSYNCMLPYGLFSYISFSSKEAKKFLRCIDVLCRAYRGDFMLHDLQ